MESYWDAGSYIIRIMAIGITAYLFHYFLKPFEIKKRAAECAGFIYFAVILVLYCIPYEMEAVFAYAVGTAAVLAAMYFVDRGKLEQKIFLIIIFYLLQWISGGIAIIPRNILFNLFINTEAMNAAPKLQFGLYLFVEILYTFSAAFLILQFSNLMKKIYKNKKENITKGELVYTLAPLLSVMVGYWVFSFFADAYENDLKIYIWNAYAQYKWLLALYQIAAFAVIVIVIVTFQRIKKNQREEKENAVLAGQIEDLERHIYEVEKLYHDMRSLKHDMKNHLITLENLYQKNEYEEAQKYAVHLTKQYNETTWEAKSGNPVTDVILTEKKKEAEEKGITFLCEFFYPENTKILSFDLSVILINSITNAIEAARGGENPYIHISSYCKKNAYMIEIENSMEGVLILNEDSGLPETTKADREGHGFGLANIRKIAAKYMGDIDIEQKENCFMLSIMLMVQ